MGLELHHKLQLLESGYISLTFLRKLEMIFLRADAIFESSISK